MCKSDLLTYFLEFNMISEILALVTIINRIFFWTIISVLRKYVRGIRKFGAKHFWGQSDNISQECSGRRQNHSLAETRSNLSHSSTEYNEFSNCATFKGNPPLDTFLPPECNMTKQAFWTFDWLTFDIKTSRRAVFSSLFNQKCAILQLSALHFCLDDEWTVKVYNS